MYNNGSKVIFLVKLMQVKEFLILAKHLPQGDDTLTLVHEALAHEDLGVQDTDFLKNHICFEICDPT